MIADPQVARRVRCRIASRPVSAVDRGIAEIGPQAVLVVGGSDPFIVLDSDDLAEPVKAAVAGPMAMPGGPARQPSVLRRGDLYADFVSQFTAAMPRCARISTDPASAPGHCLRGGRRTPDRADQRRRDRAPRCTRRPAGRPAGRVRRADGPARVTPQMRAYREIRSPRPRSSTESWMPPRRCSWRIPRLRARRRRLSADPGRVADVAPARYRHGVDQQPDELDGRPSVWRDQALRRAPGFLLASSATSRHAPYKRLQPSRMLTEAPGPSLSGPAAAARAPSRSPGPGWPGRERGRSAGRGRPPRPAPRARPAPAGRTPATPG